MKFPILVTASAVLFTAGAIQAQNTGADRDDKNQPRLNTDRPGATQQQGDVIQEPAGAERQSGQPQGRPFGQDRPPGRAFSETNPPPGRPFLEGGPQGRPFRTNDVPGAAVDEPAGAEKKPDAGVSDPAGAGQRQDSDIADPAGAERKPDAGQTQPGGLKPGDPGFAAGAQRQEVTQLQNALAEIRTGTTLSAQQTQRLEQSLTAVIRDTTAPREFVSRLASDLVSTFSKVELNQEARVRFVTALETALNAKGADVTQIQQAITQVQQILISNGVSRPQARAVACDLHLIASEISGQEISIPLPR